MAARAAASPTASAVMLSLSVGEDRAHGLLRGRSGSKRPGPATLLGRLFSVGGRAAFTSRDKIAGPLRSSAEASALRLRCGCRSVPPAAFVAMKAAMGAADPTRKAAMTTDHDDDFEPHHSSSPTDQVLHELQLYGYRPFNDEPDPRPLPEAQHPRRQHLRHLRRPRGGAGRHSPRTRPRGPALVDGERLPSRHRHGSNANSTTTSWRSNARNGNRMAARSNPSSWNA